jgi:hypothetical protein
MASPAREFFVDAKEAGKVIGDRCKYCAIIARSKALSGTLLARHVVFGWKGGTGGRVPIEMRGQIWGRYHVPSQEATAPTDPLAERSRLAEARPVLALGSPVIPFTSTIPPQLASPALMRRAPTPPQIVTRGLDLCSNLWTE